MSAEKITQTLEVPVVDAYDVVVCGGGPAGLAAAVEAGRAGARTLILERTACLGGTATAGMMALIVLPPDKLRGFQKEFLSALAAENKAGRNRAITWDVEAYKILADKMVRDAGVDVLFNTWISDAVVENGAISAVIVENKSGRQAIRASVVVDATGDGDIACRAGVPCTKGRESDHKMRPLSILGQFSNVNMVKLKEYAETHREDVVVDPLRAFCNPAIGEMRYDGLFSVVERAKENGLMRKDTPVNYLRLSAMVPPEAVESAQVVVNCTRIYDVDATNVKELSNAEIEGRRQLQEIHDACRAYLPGFEASVWASTATLMGVRETRRISGKYTLTYDDIQNGTAFDDTVATMTATNYGTAEVHGPDRGHEGSKNDKWAREMALDFIDFSFPLRCMLTDRVDNLVVAGRCASMTHDADKFTRGIAMVSLMGQAAGAYAAMRAGGNAPLEKLQEKLRAEGVMN